MLQTDRLTLIFFLVFHLLLYPSSSSTPVVAPTRVVCRIRARATNRSQIRWQYGASAFGWCLVGISARVVVSVSGQRAVRCQRIRSDSSTVPASRRHIGTSRVAGISARLVVSVSCQIAVRCQCVRTDGSTMPARQNRWQYGASIS